MRGQHIGFLFQDSSLDERRSILANLLEPSLYQRRGAARGALRIRAEALLAELALDIPMSRQAARLSGGQMQRLALARAVLLEPEILLADEPTGNLDAGTGGLVLSYLDRYARSGHTVIIITHNAGVAVLANECLILEEGRLLSRGATE